MLAFYLNLNQFILIIKPIKLYKKEVRKMSIKLFKAIKSTIKVFILFIIDYYKSDELKK